MTDETIEARKNELEQWFHNAMTLPGGAEPSLEELIPDEFLAENTDFDSLDQFVEEAPLSVESDELIQPEIDDFVMANSELGSWQQFQQQIEVRWMQNSLD